MVAGPTACRAIQDHLVADAPLPGALHLLLDPSLAKARPNELSLDQLRERLEEAAQWGVPEVLFSGGEPLIRRDDVLALTRHAYHLGMVPTLITSGSVGDRALLERLVQSGLGSLMLSLDGADAATHDQLRGRTGSFEEVLGFVRGALAYRAEVGAGPDLFTVYVQSVIVPENAGRLSDMAALVRELGADGYLVQALAPDAFLEEHRFGADGLAHLRRELRALAPLAESGFLMNSQAYLDAIEPFYAGTQDPAGRRCLAGYDTLVIAPDGSVSSCRETLTREILGPDREPLSLREAWRHPKFSEARKTMRVCKDPCMINCWYVE